MPVSLKDELAASKMLVDLLEKAEQTRQFYQGLRLPLPDALRRLLGSNGTGLETGTGSAASFKLPAMPPEAGDDWAWILVKECSPGTLIKVLLRQPKTALRSKELFERINALDVVASLGTVSNAAVRLETQEVITRDPQGAWTLAKSDEAGILYEGYVWGPQSIFTVHELAAHRREAILQILRKWPGGLQMVQLTEHLRQLEWLRAPVNKDLVKADLDRLQGEGKVRRALGHSKKWVLATQD
ncbi:MAG: hypothetical protein WA628_01040 [Terriglobales bacterium]